MLDSLKEKVVSWYESLRTLISVIEEDPPPPPPADPDTGTED